MNSRLLGVLVLVAFTLLAAVTAGAYAGRQATTTTLTMWSYDNQDPGLEPVLKQLSKDFEKSHPGVKINLVFKDFNSLVGTVPRALASGSGPDVTEGNQGYQTDAQLVKAKLILPLTKYVKKYGWDKLYAPSTWGMFRWTPDGKSFGKGPVWGIAQTGQNVAVFYNKKKLRQAGLNPNKMPQTFAGFDRLLGQLRAKLPDSDPVIMAGNKEGYGFIHLFGGIWGASVKPTAVRNWIYHVPGSRYDTPGTIKALAKLQQWGK
ncbi:MAG TPA: ABC transporter substrate-binding protein, partial [Gaiella sp.]|nr:ABC transporter substrate-binding protein [Gaiella sp.]